MQFLQRHYKKRCITRKPSTFSRLTKEETVIALIAGEYLDVRNSTTLAMTSYSVSDTIRRCAIVKKLAFNLPSGSAADIQAGRAVSSYVATRILSAAKTFAKILSLEVSGTHVCNAHFDLTGSCQIKDWCIGIHSEEKRNRIRSSNMAFANRFFQGLQSISIKNVRLGFDDKLLAWIMSLTRSGHQDNLEELSLIHCPCVHLDISDRGTVDESLVFPKSLYSIRLDGCGILSTEAITYYFQDKCPQLSHLSILRTPAFLKWLKEGPLTFSRSLLSLEIVQNMLKSTALLQEGLSKHSRSMRCFISLLKVIEDAQGETNDLLKQVETHLMSDSSPAVFTHETIKDAINRDKDAYPTQNLMAKGVNMLRRVYGEICTTVIECVCQVAGPWNSTHNEFAFKDLSKSAAISETDFVHLIKLSFQLHKTKISSIAAFFAERCTMFSDPNSRFRQLLSTYANRSFGHGAHDCWKVETLMPFNSLRLNRLLLESLREPGLNSDTISEFQYDASSPEALVALMNIALSADGGGGCVPECQLLLSTAAVLPTCSTETLEFLLRLGMNPNNRWGDTNWFTPLMGAAQSGSSAKTLSLLKYGSNPKLECHNGSTALHFAIPSTSKSSARTVRLLGTSLGPEYIRSYRERLTGYTVLHRTALEAERLSVFKAVMSFNGIEDIVNVHCREDGHSALQFACVESSDAHVRVRLLLAAGASVDLRDTKNGDTALLFCCRNFWLLNRNALVLRVLLEYGADRDARSRSSPETNTDESSTFGESALDLLYKNVHNEHIQAAADKTFISDVRKRATKLLTEYESPSMYTKRRRLGAFSRRKSKSGRLASTIPSNTYNTVNYKS